MTKTRYSCRYTQPIKTLSMDAVKSENILLNEGTLLWWLDRPVDFKVLSTLN